ncbi:MAG TPA: acetate--CoA ligase family protein, partial [Candidatus Binatia bacterium]|nr:acetate--CoA ligase family protein [Candidatus Binatia bacterium]
MGSANLKSLFQPRSVALIGVSNEPNKLSGRPFRFFREYGYAGKVYPVNPKYQEIAGVPCFATLSDIPGEVDLAVITLPAIAVPEALAECGAKGAKAAAIISSGFAEVGGEGARLQEELTEVASKFGIAVCGPNCSGFVYFPERVTATFSVGIEGGFPETGPAAFISQSGALSSYILGAAKERGLAFRYWITTGNECVLSFTDYLKYVLEDPEVRFVLGYLEDVREGEAFQDIARRALSLDKPLIIMKTGRSEAGARASISHTGSLAGVDEVYEAVFSKNGVLRAETLDELFDLALLAQGSRRPRGRRVQVVSISGAAGILMADVGSELGLEFSDLSPVIKGELKEIMPPFASIANPMDVTAEAVARPGLLTQAAEVILTDPNVDNLVMFFGIVPGAHEKLAAGVAKVAQTTDKLVMMTWFPLPHPDIWMNLARAGVPVFSEPARGVRALGKMAQYEDARQRKLAPGVTSISSPFGNESAVEEILDQAKNQSRNALSEVESKSLLKAFGFRVPRSGFARNATEARSLFIDIGAPVALKASSPALLHKTEAGVIRLGLKNLDEVERAFEEIVAQATKWNPQVRLDGVLVEEMIGSDAKEVIVGARQDLRFGPVVTFGLGGIFVEAIRDFAVWPAPLTLDEAREIIRKIRGYHILTAFRGRPAADVEALARTLCQVGQVAYAWRERIAELEINPLFVLP